MRIEILFPEICNLYGELQNIEYLKKSCPELEVVETHLVGEPEFMKETPNLVYMGTLTERGQVLAIEKLSQYKEKLEAMIEEGVHFLITGNALEIFGKTITDKNGTVVEGLGMFPITTKRDMMNRFNSLYLGKMGDMDVVGFKSQFTQSYWDGQVEGYVFDTTRGPGLNPDIKEEGIRKKNFLATYVIGPILVVNPPLAKWILKEIGVEVPALAYEKEAMDAYEVRVKEYSNPETGFYY